jgi:hypothetical protein
MGEERVSDYTPTTDEVRDSLVHLNKYYAERHGDFDLLVVKSETAAQFDRMIAEVRREAAEKAWNRCVGEMPIDPDWKNFYGDNNPYRAEAYRQERKEQ